MKTSRNYFTLLLVTLCTFAKAQTWERISTTNAPVHALEVFNNELVAGGRFSTVDNQFTSTVASWNGLNWSMLGQGNQFVEYETCNDLHVYNNKLYAGGSLKINGNNPYSWSMTSLLDLNWMPNIFTEEAFFCLNLDKNTMIDYQGIHYAVGDFCNSFDTCGYANFIARSSGGTWTPLDNCETNNNSATTVVRSMTIHHDSLFMSIEAWRSEDSTYDILATWDGENFDIHLMESAFDFEEITYIESLNGELFAITSNWKFGKWNSVNFDFSQFNSGILVYYQILGVYNEMMYVATSQGLMRFNGTNFLSSSEQLESPTCLILFQNELYGGFYDGVFKLNAPNWIGLNSPENEKFTLYPNPATNQITIKHQAENLNFINVKDVFGRICDLEFQISENQLIIHRGNLPSGIYFIEFQDENKFISKRKIIFY